MSNRYAGISSAPKAGKQQPRYTTKYKGKNTMSNIGFIYALIDPRDNKIRYIGQTKRAPKQRYHEHISLPRNKEMRQWMASLALDEVWPIMKIVEQVNAARLNERERYWITVMCYRKQRLFNDNCGWEGLTAFNGEWPLAEPYSDPVFSQAW